MSQPSAILALLACLVALWPGDLARAEDGVFVYKNEQGREVFTNHKNLVPKGVEWEEMELPQLVEMDLEQAPPEQLAKINTRLEIEHERMQSSSVCQEAVKEAAVPWYTRLVRDQPHWLAIGGMMLLLIFMNRYLSELLPGGTWMRFVMFLMPLLILFSAVLLAAVVTHRTARATRTRSDGRNGTSLTCERPCPRASRPRPD